MSDRFKQPFGIYDTKNCGLVYIGLYENEAEIWQVYLGWPDAEEISHAKRVRGLRAIPLTMQYNIPTEADDAVAE